MKTATGKRTYKILAIDGGGIRGVVPAHILACVQHRLGFPLSQSFDLIAGTSTGAIIAAAIACDIDPGAIKEMYLTHGQAIFAKPKLRVPFFHSLFTSIYSNQHLRKVLAEVFDERRLGEVAKPLILPATDVGHGGVHVFKSSYSADFTRDNHVLVRDAVLGSCSAPTFFDPIRVNEYLIADGGLWANNPALVAVVDAVRRLKVPLEDVRILSIGTGESKVRYQVHDRRWGFATGWRRKEFINFLLSLQSQVANNYLGLLLERSQILRINFERDTQLPLDDCSQIDNLVSEADRLFTHQSSAIRNFLTDTNVVTA